MITYFHAIFQQEQLPSSTIQYCKMLSFDVTLSHFNLSKNKLSCWRLSRAYYTCHDMIVSEKLRKSLPRSQCTLQRTALI